ncbi:MULTISPECIES: RHS repeat-associated core domain-containing protein [unclassified Brenneria]|uniref:RHS repeat-associated core domain-containing protein n=1 Tax=unclassified Brenneria TaxID=2634434 RepID=UPI001F3B773D|nr:RHS repeat-associated core domain-containing protein [Brenneria sp. L3-3C-1]MEE3645283.1 RHS repeat-associated core domain-containing protein [Brenneria sp. L3_3C_1]
MSENKQATLLSSEEAANRNFSTDKKISGGCTQCGCETLIYYHYDSGKPVPNAPFVLIDSNKTEIHGQTDANGLCFIYDMGCGTYELMLDEGTDEFEPEPTVENNPVLQSSPAYAALAGEYFTLYLRLRKQGLLSYDADDSSDSKVDVDGAGLLTLIPDDYRKEYNRFWELDGQINRGSRQLKQAINKIHHSLAAEVANQGDDDNAALIMLCQIILGCIPVVGQALDVYAIGDWCWRTYKQPALMDDTLHRVDGALCVIGVVPGLGDAIKVSGRAILHALENGSPKAIQFAIKTIRSLSDGNLVRGLTKLRGLLTEYAQKGKAVLETIYTALTEALKASSKDSWLVGLMKERFSIMTQYLGKLIKGYEEAIALLKRKFDDFIPLIVSRTSGSTSSKGAFEKAAQARKPHANSEAAPSTSPAKSDTAKGGKPKEAAEKDNASVPETANKVNAGRNADERGGTAEQQQRARQADEKNCATSDKCQSVGEPVDMATGYVVDWRTDFHLAGVLPFAMKRYYRSGGERKPGLLGTLWRSLWDMSLVLDKGLVTLTDGEFNQAIFVLPAEGESNRSPSTPQWRLTRQQGQLVLQHVDGLRYRFEHALGLQLCLTAIEDASGNRISLLWERATLCWLVLPDTRLIHVETHHRRMTRLTLCDAHRQPLKTLASYTYDARGHLLGVRAGEGRNFDYTYSPQGWLLRWSDLAHTWVEHDYDEKGRAICDRTSGGYWPGRFEYDDETLTNHYHSGFGGVISYVRDERNNILLRRSADGGETRFEWVDNQLAAEIDPLGNRTTYQRNDWGQVTAVTLPDGATHRYDYDDDGHLLAYTDPQGSVWRYQRNATGQVVEVNDPEGREWLHSYHASGALATLIGPDGVLQRYHYNARGLLSGLERDNAPSVTFIHDDHDRLTERHIAHEQGTQVRRWVYEGGRDAPSTVIYEDGSETRFGYDVEGNLTGVTDALGQRYQFRYGAFDNLLEATDPLGATVRYHYNAEAEFAGVTNSQGQDWRYVFDTRGRLSEERHYDGRVYRYGYDIAGRLVSRTAPDGSEVRYAHDAAGRVITVTTLKTDGATEGITTLEYDIAGRLVKAASSDAVVEYTYNRAGQVTSETVNGEAVTSGYDAGGQRAVVAGILAPLTQAWSSGQLSALGIGAHQPLSFSHTASGEEQYRSNGAGFALRQEWSPTGLLQRQALEGADGRVNDVLERRYQYDALDRLTGISDSHWGEQAFRLNGAGQVTAERREQGRRRQARLFGYDSEQNLCEVSQIAPGLGGALVQKDAVVQSASRYDAAGRVVERGYAQYRYDDCGRLEVKREARPGFRPKETRYEWDAQDRLVRVLLPDGARWRYRYDAFGRRVSKAREGQLPSAQAVATVHYRWDGDQLVGQRQYLADGTAAREVQWVYEPGSFRPVAQVESKGESTRLHYIVTDVTGTARELCSEEGAVHWRGEQGLWGGYREEKIPIRLRRYLGDAANEEVYCNLRYQGQLYDAETGLYYNRHRYYDAESGQYISSDPIGLAGGIRPQGYVHNPLEWVDPLGLVGCPPDPKKMSRAERQARIDELAEANAHRRLQEMENATPRAHFLERHGAQTSLESQLSRATNGANPTTGVQQRTPTAATRFNSHRDQLNSIQRAQTIYRQSGGTNTAITIPHGKVIGEGYSKIGPTYGTSSTSKVILNPNGQPITAFPVWGH